VSKVTPADLPFAEIPNCQVVETARQFRETADLLHACLGEHRCVLPLMMVATFGIELFLKSLNSKCVYHQDEDLAALGVFRVTAEPLRKGHPLVPLFGAIDDRFRPELEKSYTTNRVISGKATLREALADYDLFSNARYPFEAGKEVGQSSITGLVRLLDLIADHVDKLPKLVVFPDDSGS
jgi:hypothetical protein